MTAAPHTGPITTPAVVRTGEALTTAPEEARDLSSLTDVEFDRALARLELRKVRAQRIFQSTLVKDVHYGTIPNTKKPSLYKPGADELATTFGLEVVYDPQRPDAVVETEQYASVTVYRAIVDRQGHVLDRTMASCTSKEGKFKRRDGGFTYVDAREKLNDCFAIAEKRAKVRLVVSALGLAPFLGTEEEMEAAMASAAPVVPWTEIEKRACYSAAGNRGMSKEQFAKLCVDTVGRTKVASGDEASRVLAAIAAWKAPEPGNAKAPAPAMAGASDQDYQDDTDIDDA